MEKIINDGLDNVITLRYDETTDKVTVNNDGIHVDFREVYLNEDPGIVENVITIQDTNGGDEWENYTDDYGRTELQLFWETHKKNKEIRGLSL
jgi:hypothetical protein